MTLIGSAKNASVPAQQDSSSHRFTLVGLSYTYMHSFGQGDYWLDYSYSLDQNHFHGGAVDAIYHTRFPHLAFQMQTRFLENRYTYTKSRDPRLPQPTQYPAFRKTVSNVDEHLLAVGTYFAVTTKGQYMWLFAEIGPEVIFSLGGTTNKHTVYTVAVATPPPYYADSTGANELTRQNAHYKMLQLGFRMGTVFTISESLYASIFIQPRLLGGRELIPLGNRFLKPMPILSFSLYYRLQ